MPRAWRILLAKAVESACYHYTLPAGDGGGGVSRARSMRAHLDGLEPTVDEAAGYYARDDGPAVPLDAYRAFFATVLGKMEMAEARLPHNYRERRLPFLLCRHRRKDAEARVGDDVLVKLAIDAPLDLVRKVLKYV